MESVSVPLPYPLVPAPTSGESAPVSEPVCLQKVIAHDHGPDVHPATSSDQVDPPPAFPGLPSVVRSRSPSPVLHSVTRVRSSSRESGGGECEHPSVTHDPHNVSRFAKRQAIDHKRALCELRAGRKAGCWSWWILPTPPFMKNGREVGSGLNRDFAIRSDAEGAAYLQYNGGQLRDNYLAIMTAVADALDSGVRPKTLLGIDVPRCTASSSYFGKLATTMADEELRRTTCRVGRLLQSATAS